jgi:hypothetical protein
VPIIEQSHHLLSLFRQSTDAERRVLLADILDVALDYLPKARAHTVEMEATARVIEMAQHLVQTPAPLDIWQLAQVALDFGHMNLTTDLKVQTGKAQTAGARAKRREDGEPLRDAARGHIQSNPKTHLADTIRALKGKGFPQSERTIARTITELFEPVPGHNHKRPKRPTTD